MNIILASKSPRRIEIFKSMNIDFKSINADINENKYSYINNPSQHCMKLAKLKASKIFSKNLNSIIIGADTIVYINHQILGKPKNKKNAFNILKELSDKTHYVYTGVAIKCKNYNLNFYDKTSVTFYPLTDEIINYYINNFNPLDKAGAYGIQDWSKVFIKKINGCYYNVVGFPIAKFYQHINDSEILKKYLI